MGSWKKFRKRVEKQFVRTFDHVQSIEADFRESMGMDKVGGRDLQEWMKRNGPLTTGLFDVIGVGAFGGTIAWDMIHPPKNLQPWNGGEYMQYRNGFIIEVGHSVPVSSLIVDPNNSYGGFGPETFFVGHLPDCEFDELTMTMTGGDYLDESKVELGRYVGANLYQVVDPSGDNTEILSVSGTEEQFDPDEPGRIYRQSLRLPWRSRLRVSETYGGPTESRIPTLVSMYAHGIDGSTPGVNDWEIQVTSRFIAEPIR